MLHVILLILKILGIILLIAIGLLLFALYAVLFVAVSYRVRVRRGETFQATGTAAWLFRIVTVYFHLEEAAGWNPVLQVRIFGYPVWRILGEEDKKRDTQRRKKRRRPGKKKGRREARIQDESQKEKKEEQVLQEDEAGLSETFFQGTEERTQTIPKRQKKLSFMGIFRKIACAARKICDKIKHICEKIAGIGDKIRYLRDRRDVFLDFWHLEEHQRARSALWKEAQYLWKKSHPKKIKGWIHFGFSDPAHTGLCMGVLGMLCAWYPKQLELIPDFEQRILESDVQIRGRVRCYVFALILWRIYFNQDIRRMYQHWQEL